jgi:hypothetical protein
VKSQNSQETQVITLSTITLLDVLGLLEFLNCQPTNLLNCSIVSARPSLERILCKSDGWNKLFDYIFDLYPHLILAILALFAGLQQPPTATNR